MYCYKCLFLYVFILCTKMRTCTRSIHVTPFQQTALQLGVSAWQECHFWRKGLFFLPKLHKLFCILRCLTPKLQIIKMKPLLSGISCSPPYCIKMVTGMSVTGSLRVVPNNFKHQRVCWWEFLVVYFWKDDTILSAITPDCLLQSYLL